MTKTKDISPDMTRAGTRRRYQKLRDRADDQAGTPEGDLCEKMAGEMLKRWPRLADIDASERLAVMYREYRFQTEQEQLLLVRLGEYLGLEAKSWARSRKKVVLFEADEPTHAAIEQTFAVLRAQLAEVMRYAYAGFVYGSLPLARDVDATPDATPPDESLLKMAREAMSVGRSGRPRKAITGSQ